MKTLIFNRREFFQKLACYSGMFAFGFFKKTDYSKKRYSSEYNGKITSSRVIIAQKQSVRNKDGKLVDSEVQKLVNTAVENLVQISPAQKAWASLFNKRDTVGIKINCLAGKGLSTHSVIVDSIIDGLLSAGVQKNKIIVWDRLNDDLERAGYTIKTDKQDVRYFGNDYCGYDPDLHIWGEIGSLVSRVVTHECSALINVPVLKDHGIVGVTLGLKNYFGAIHNPNKYHDNIGDPYVADVNMIPVIRKKTRLTLCDGLTAQYEGGPPFMPQWSWHFNGVLAAKDMVAMDTVGWQIIEKKRQEKGLPALVEIGREPTYIATAADGNHDLGTNDPSRIEIIRP